MNKTFKVVFSRTRSSFVVTNEITRSLKKKGAKALLVAAALTLSSLSYAGFGDLFSQIFSPFGFDSTASGTQTVVEESEPVIVSNQQWNASTQPTSIEAWSPTDATASEFHGINLESSASGAASDISVVIDANKPTGTSNLTASVYGIYNDEVASSETSGPAFTGKTLSVSVNSEFNGAISAVKVSKDTFVSADNTTLYATTQQAKEVDGLQVMGDDASFVITGNTTISAIRTVSENVARINGVYQEGKNRVSIGSAGKSVSISATSERNPNKGDAVYLTGGANFTALGSKITINSTGHGLYVVNSSTASLGDASTETISISTDSTGVRASANKNASAGKSVVTLTAKTVSIVSRNEEGLAFGVVDEGNGYSEINVNATTIDINSKNTALEVVANGSRLNLMASDSITVTTESGAGLEIDDADSSANLVAKRISITSQKEDALTVSAGLATLKAEDSITLTSTDPSTGTHGFAKKWDRDTAVLVEKSAKVALVAGTLVIKHENHLPVAAAENASDDVTLTGVGIGSYSGAELTIKAATEIDAATSIHVSDGSTTKINTDAARKTTIAGDVVFDSDANLEIALSGSDSSFTGRAYQTYKTADKTVETVSLKPIADVRDAVTGFALKVSDGAKWVLTEGKSFVNKLTLAGGTIDASKATAFNAGKYNATTGKVEAGITVEGTGNTLILGETTEADVTIEMAEGSELVTPLSTAFTLTKEAVKGVVTDAVNRLTVTLKEGAKSAAIKINDAFTLTTEAFAKMNAQYSNVTLNLVNMELETVASETGEVGITQFTNDVALKTLTGNADFSVAPGKNLTLSGRDGESQIHTLSLAGAPASSSKLMLKNGTKAKISEIVGSGSGAVELSDASDLAVGAIHDVEAVALGAGSTLTLGTAGETTESKVGKISLSSGAAGATLKAGNQTKVKVDAIEGTGTIQIAEESELSVKKLSGASKITVGEVGGKGATLSVEKLEMHGGSLFFDPLYGHTTATISSFGSSGLDTNINVGSGALVILGSASESEARGKISKISEIANAQTVLYVATPVTVARSGSIVVDSSLTEEDSNNLGRVAFRNDATLVIDQAAVGTTVFSGEAGFSIFVGSALNIGIVNASQGVINLGSEISLDGGSVSLYTDSPFLTASLDNATGSITLTQTVTNDALAVVTSMGVQTMIRNADAVLAQTIADRTAALEKGNGLWATVRGERFKQTSLGGGAGFKANVGYGAFGAEFTPTDKTSLGVAFQYGHGTVKGKVYSVKNKTKDYSFTLYGSALLGETGINLLGEVAYTKSENDITTS